MNHPPDVVIGCDLPWSIPKIPQTWWVYCALLISIYIYMCVCEVIFDMNLPLQELWSIYHGHRCHSFAINRVWSSNWLTRLGIFTIDHCNECAWGMHGLGWHSNVQFFMGWFLGPVGYRGVLVNITNMNRIVGIFVMSSVASKYNELYSLQLFVIFYRLGWPKLIWGWGYHMVILPVTASLAAPFWPSS